MPQDNKSERPRAGAGSWIAENKNKVNKQEREKKKQKITRKNIKQLQKLKREFAIANAIKLEKKKVEKIDKNDEEGDSKGLK